jgi:hypothetical protein
MRCSLPSSNILTFAQAYDFIEHANVAKLRLLSTRVCSPDIVFTNDISASIDGGVKQLTL